MRAKIAGLFLLLLGLNVQAADLFAPFQGSRLSGLTRSSTIAEYDGTTDASGNLLDLSGSNYCPASEQMDLWGLGSTYVSVVANQYRNPVNNQLTADSVKEYGSGGGGDATAYHYIQKTGIAASVNVRYTISAYVMKGARDWVMLQAYDATAIAERAASSFNISTGAVGTYAAPTTASMYKVAGNWYRVSISWIQPVDSLSCYPVISALEANNDQQYAGSDQVAFVAYGVQMAKNDQWRQGPGIYHPTTSTVTKPLHDLAPTAAPTMAYSYLQDRDGNRRQARTFNGSNYYSVAHHDSMNIFDGDFVITQVVKSPAAIPGASIVSFSHGLSVGDGVYVGMNSSGYYYSFFNKAGVQAGPAMTTSFADGRYHTLQLERISNVATLYADGTASSPANVSTYGIDGSRTFYVGCYNGPGAYWTSGILYTRIDSASMTQEELAKDREALQGTLAGSGNLSPGWTFTRTTTASMTYANGTIGYAAANVPRVGGDGGGVLVEEQRENKCLYSQDFSNAYWHKQKLSVPATSVVLPDGTTGTVNTLRSTSDAGDPQLRYLYGTAITTVASSVYTYSIYLKAANRTWANIQVYDGVGGYNAYVNTATCTTGTTAGGAVVTAVQSVDGWCRFSIKYTALGTAALAEVLVADADGDQITTGDDTDSYYVFGGQHELGAHPTSLITTTSASVTRTQDSLTMEPWKLNKGVNPGLANPTMTARFESDVYATGTYTSETGAYAFIVSGDTKRQASQTLGDWFAFDGTGDSLGITSSAFNPAGNFSIMAIITPTTVSGDHIIVEKWVAAGDQRSYQLYQTNADLVFKRTTTGLDSVTATLAGALVANKTSLVTASYNTVSGLTVRADALAPATMAGVGVVYPGSAPFQVGGINGYYSGKIHKLDFFSTYAITDTDHDNMLAQLKQPNALPVKVGNSYEHKKLYVEYDMKCPFSNAAEAGLVGKIHFGISGNTGTADADTNVLTIYSVGDTLSAYVYADGEATGRYMSTTLITPNNWHHYKYYFNFADLTTSTGYIDSTALTLNASMTGAKNFDLTNAMVRVGQNYSGNGLSTCRFKNLRVRAAP